MKKLFSASLLLMVLLAAGVVGIRLGLGNQFLGEQIAATLSANPQISKAVRLNFKAPQFNIKQFTAASAVVFINRIFAGLELTELVIKPKLPALINGKLSADLWAEILEGKLAARISFSPLSNGIGVSGQADQLKLYKYYPLVPLQLDGGTLTISTPALVCSGDFMNCQGNVVLNLTDLSKAAPTVLRGSVVVPAIPKSSLVTAVEIEGGSIRANKIEVTSDYGSINGSARLQLAKDGRLFSFSSVLTFTLTDIGKSQLGPLLPSLTDGRVRSDAERFILEIIGDKGIITLMFSPLANNS